MKILYKEPLLHFLVIGAALFVLFSIVNKEETLVNGNEIIVSTADINRLSESWSKKWNRPPSEAELQGLIESHIKEEVYYREALALGLDREDTIIRRRMMQKLEFLTNDIAALNTPDEAELKNYFLEHQDDYQLPAQLSFSHIYFNRDKRGQKIITEANNVLEKISQASAKRVNVSNYGDSFMLQSDYELVTQNEIERFFGNEFAEQLLNTPVTKWQGPIESAYGLHLVWIDERIDAQLPELSAVIDKVRTDWEFEQRKKANAQMYQHMKGRYEVVIEASPKQSGVAEVAAPVKGTSS
jgi:hypothetical protein